MNEHGADPMLRGLAAGDEEAFRLLHDRFATRLYRAALRMLGRAEDAEDAVQESFLGIVKSRKRLRDVDDLTAYLFASLRNAARRRLSQLSRDAAAADALRAAPPGPASDRAAVPDAVDARLHGALRALPPEQREVLALKVDGGLTFAEIARALGVSLNTAASRYRYALEKLRDRLEDGRP